MAKVMRLIDAHPIEEELEKLRGIAERKGDRRAAATADYILKRIREAPEVPLCVDREKIKADKAKKHKYGSYKNVLLSDSEITKLREKYPGDWEERIEVVSAYCAASGKTYKNYVAAIGNFAKRDKEEEKPPERERSFETEDTLQAALQRTYGGKEE